jgi:hypothetical protein
MRYTEFRDSIREELKRHSNGMTWAALQQRLNLPYARPCPEWTRRLEEEIGLQRTRAGGRAMLWQLANQKNKK